MPLHAPTMARARWRRPLCGLGVVAACISPSAGATLADRFDDTRLAAYLGYRSGQFGPRLDDIEVSGAAYGLAQQIGLNHWLRLQLNYDQVRIEPIERGNAVPVDYEQRRSSLRVGLSPRIDAGLIVLALSVEWMHLDTEESGHTWEYFGKGTRRRSGIGIGGSSEIDLGAGLTLYGEASGYSLDDIEILEGMMRVSYALRAHDRNALSLYVEGCNRRFARDEAEFQETDLRLGLDFRF